MSDDAFPPHPPRLEHIGIAVRDPEQVATLYEELLGLRPYKAETVGREGVRTHFLDAGTVKLELLEALGPDSPVARFLEKRGEGLHHLAFEVEDVDAAHARLRALGYEPLSETPRPGADGKRIFFLHPKATHGVLVELCGNAALPLEAVRVPFRGGNLAAYRCGPPEASDLVVLHGAAGTTRLETEGLLRRLEPHYRVLALDFSGHGASDDVEALPSLPLYVENVRAALDHLGIGQADVFGFSMGASVALLLAREAPDRVRRLALHGARVHWDAEAVAALQARLDPDALGERFPGWTARLHAAHGPDRWENLHRRLMDFVQTLPRAPLQEADLPRISHPTLVSAGDRDDLAGLEETLRLYRALPHAHLALLPGTSHGLHTLDVDVYAKLLRDHLGSG